MIDFHAHAPVLHGAGSWLEGGAFTVGDFLKFMDEAGIDGSVILSHDGLFHPSPRANDEVAAFAAKAPDRLFALGTVDPRDPGAPEETARCLTELRMRGLKLHPWLQGFCAHEPFMDPICRVLAEHRGMLIFHDGTPPYSTPLQIAALARRHPDVPVILGHGGLHDCWREALTAINTTPNLYICLCGTPPYAARHIALHGRRDKLLFGTDAGLCARSDHAYAADRVKEVPEWGLPEELFHALTETNPRRLLRLSR